MRHSVKNIIIFNCFPSIFHCDPKNFLKKIMFKEVYDSSMEFLTGNVTMLEFNYRLPEKEGRNGDEKLYKGAKQEGFFKG